MKPGAIPFLSRIVDVRIDVPGLIEIHFIHAPFKGQLIFHKHGKCINPIVVFVTCCCIIGFYPETDPPGTNAYCITFQIIASRLLFSNREWLAIQYFPFFIQKINLHITDVRGDIILHRHAEQLRVYYFLGCCISNFKMEVRPAGATGITHFTDFLPF